MMYRLACSVVSSSTLSAKNNKHRLEQSDEERQERRRHQRKLDDGSALIAPQKSVAGKAVAESAYAARRHVDESRQHNSCSPTRTL